MMEIVELTVKPPFLGGKGGALVYGLGLGFVSLVMALALEMTRNSKMAI